jgi:citrate lyase subunit beta / citryl-CoA lyase
MRLRSLLYVPASVEKFIAKAHTRGADAIILDLEDAVAPEKKDAARAALAISIKQAGQGGALVFVRINGDLKTAFLDVEAAQKGGAFGLYVAKASAEKLTELDRFLSAKEAGSGLKPLKFVPLIEDPAALLDAPDIARRPRVLALQAGSEDLATALGADPDPDVLRVPKQLIHYAAKAAGKLSFGLFRTVADYTDLKAIRAAAGEAKRHGFDGASCIHPTSVAILNEAFSPSAAEIDWARRVVAAAAATCEGAFAFEGRMVDAPIVERARKVLANAQSVSPISGYQLSDK